MSKKKLFLRLSILACSLSIVLVSALAVLPENSAAQAVVINEGPLQWYQVVSCPDSEGILDVVLVTFTSHRVDIDGVPPQEIGAWSNATGYGLLTGDTYRGSSASNAIPGSDLFRTSITLNAPGRDGLHFTITRIGPLFGAPTDIIQCNCH